MSPAHPHVLQHQHSLDSVKTVASSSLLLLSLLKLYLLQQYCHEDVAGELYTVRLSVTWYCDVMHWMSILTECSQTLFFPISSRIIFFCCALFCINFSSLTKAKLCCICCEVLISDKWHRQYSCTADVIQLVDDDRWDIQTYIRDGKLNKPN